MSVMEAVARPPAASRKRPPRTARLRTDRSASRHDAGQTAPKIEAGPFAHPGVALSLVARSHGDRTGARGAATAPASTQGGALEPRLPLLSVLVLILDAV